MIVQGRNDGLTGSVDLGATRVRVAVVNREALPESHGVVYICGLGVNL